MKGCKKATGMRELVRENDIMKTWIRVEKRPTAFTFIKFLVRLWLSDKSAFLFSFSLSPIHTGTSDRIQYSIMVITPESKLLIYIYMFLH